MSAPPLQVVYERRYLVHAHHYKDNKEFTTISEAIEYARLLLERGDRATIFHLDRELKQS